MPSSRKAVLKRTLSPQHESDVVHLLFYYKLSALCPSTALKVFSLKEHQTFSTNPLCLSQTNVHTVSYVCRFETPLQQKCVFYQCACVYKKRLGLQNYPALEFWVSLLVAHTADQFPLLESLKHL